MWALRREMERFRVPLLVVHGLAKKVAKSSGSRQLQAQAGSSGKTLAAYPKRYHDPLNDIGGGELPPDNLAWLVARGPTPRLPP